MEKIINKLTIYSSFAQINEIIKLNSTKDTLLDLENGIIASSLILQNINNIVEPVYIKSKKYVTVHVHDKVYSGILKSMNDDNISIVNNNIITIIRNYNYIKYNNNDNCLVLSNSNIYNLTYLTDSIYWTPQYIIYISNKIDATESITILLQANIHIKNKEYIDKNYEIELISNHDSTNTILNKNNNIQYSSSQNNTYDHILTENNYKNYLIQVDILGNNNIITLSSNAINSIKYYLHIIGQEKTEYGYMFKSIDYMPPGNVIINTYDNKYLGSTKLVSSVENELNELLIGGSKLVKVKSILSSINKEITNNENDITKNEMNEDESNVNTVTNNTVISVYNEIINNTNMKILLILRLYTENKKLISTTSDIGIEVKDTYIDYHINIEKQKLTFNIDAIFEY
uniref:Uncharacterized protein n=1 Tax=Pithovirus LCPAC102 TaxID=2506587 RepID=A0A481Z423_9VIRU|nr:MAG: hypothetical protein LCPAC102_01170 [Pithovirus LCPAC102]